LDTERTVAEAAQRAVVPPVPERVGPVRCAGLYRAAERGTLVGGDFFDVRESPHGVRAVLGDVRGHGLAAIATVASLLGAFREAVLDQPDLESVAARLDRRLVVDSAQVTHTELFATAVLLEFAKDAAAVRVLVCGHPPPVLLRDDGTASEVTAVPWTPLGLALPGADPPVGRVLELHPGDRLFLASDGVWEARNGAGTFYPLAERLPALTDGADPAATASRVWADVLRHSPAVRDDVTMLVLAPDAPGRPRSR
ncbi:PP2C family protein-serine/threonine phosphatase, partial [Streptomyces sp. NPDC002920]